LLLDIFFSIDVIHNSSSEQSQKYLNPTFADDAEQQLFSNTQMFKNMDFRFESYNSVTFTMGKPNSMALSSIKRCTADTDDFVEVVGL